MLTPYYEDEYATIYHGDCREVLPRLESVDLVLTDPPYGIGFDALYAKAHGKQYGKAKAAKGTYLDTNWDTASPTAEVFRQITAMSQEQIIWGGHLFNLQRSSGWLVWSKETNGQYGDCELAWTSFDRPIREFKWRWNGMLQQDMKRKEARIHPTQKPVPLMKWCLGFAPEAKTVLDPFMGSGTTLVAAKQLGLKSIGIELEEKYCAIAAERLRQRVLWEVASAA